MNLGPRESIHDALENPPPPPNSMRGPSSTSHVSTTPTSPPWNDITNARYPHGQMMHQTMGTGGGQYNGTEAACDASATYRHASSRT